MSTKRETITSPLSCLNRAEDDEPVFVLRAHDRVAPATVRDWAQRAKNAGVHAEKIEEAMLVAYQMERWQRAHPVDRDLHSHPPGVASDALHAGGMGRTTKGE